MTFNELLILSCFKHNYPARYTTLYHVLKGKRTASTLTYAYFYDVLSLFSIYPDLKKETYDSVLSSLIQSDFLTVTAQEQVILTDLGLAKLAAMPDFPYLENGLFYRNDGLFWEMVLFTTQVLSEKRHKNVRYTPLETNPYRQRQFKQWLTEQSSTVDRDFYEEWCALMLHLSEESRYYLVGQLSGHNWVGQTLSQISHHDQENQGIGYLKFKNALHYMMALIEIKPETYPIFYSLIFLTRADKIDTVDLTASMYRKGMNIEQIAKNRQLKESTIADHLIESSILAPRSVLTDNLTDQDRHQLDAYLHDQPDFRQWRFSECQQVIPTLTFLSFRLYQFKLVEGEKEIA
ncbi:MAG: helix-turn-helix domain-containing protein [Vagococcus sp.]